VLIYIYKYLYFYFVSKKTKHGSFVVLIFGFVRGEHFFGYCVVGLYLVYNVNNPS
jgi:hypothetical protein